MYDQNSIEDYAPWLVLVITVIGGLFRAFQITNGMMSAQETLNLWIANHSLGDMLHWISTIDQYPPLYYLLLHFWMTFRGDSAFNVRMLSALIGAAAIPFIYLIGKRMSGFVMGVAAAFFFAISPFNIRFAQDTSMYALLTFNACVAIYALVRLLTDARSIRPIGSQFQEYLRAWRIPPPEVPEDQKTFSYREARQPTGISSWTARHTWLPIQSIETDLAWVVFVIFSAATLYSHNSAVFFILAVNLFVLGLMVYQKIKQPGSTPALQAPAFFDWLKAQLGILILWSPWIISFIRQANRFFQEVQLPRPTWDGLVQTFGSLLNYAPPGRVSQVVLIWILYGIMLCFGIAHFRKKLSYFSFLAVLFAVPIFAELVASLPRPVFLDQTLIWITIPLILLLAAGIAQLRFRLLILLVLGIFITNNFFATGDYYRYAQREDWNNVAGFVANFAQKDDLVLFNATWAEIPFNYYFTYYEDLYSIQVDKHGAPVDMFDSGVREPQMTENDIPRLLSLMDGRRAVWLVSTRSPNTDPQGLIPQTLASKMRLLYTRDFLNAQVQIYGGQ